MKKQILILFIGLMLMSVIAIHPPNARSNGMQPALTATQKALVPIAAFTADGNEAKLKSALESGLASGLSVNAIKEVLIQLYAYAGFPRSLSALETFRKLMEERKANGIGDETGPAPKSLPANADKYKIGGKIQTDLVGRPVAGPLYEFAPAMDIFLKEHLFCDIFTRNVISEKDRELATISALAALPAPTQLASHLRVCQNIGFKEKELREVANILTATVSETDGKLVNDLLDKMNFADRKDGK